MPDLITNPVKAMITNDTHQSVQASTRVGSGQGFVLASPGQSIVHMAEEAGVFFQGKMPIKQMSKDARPKSSIQLTLDAVEEVGFLAGEHRVKDKRELDAPSVVSGDQKKSTQKPHEESQFTFESVLESTDDISEQKLEAFYAQLVVDDIGTSDTLRHSVDRQFKDVAQRFAALLYADNRVSEELLKAKSADQDELGWQVTLSHLKKLLNSEVRWYEEKYESNIRAGINISSVVKEFIAHERGLKASQLQAFYRDAVLDYSNLRSLYSMIIEKYAIERFKWALDFLTKSLNADYSAQGSSISKEKLKAIIDDIYQLRTLDSIHFQCERLHGQLSRFVNPISYESVFLLQQILWLQSQEMIVQNTVQLFLNRLKLEMAELAHLIVLLNGVKIIIRLIPLKMYQKKRGRENLLLAIQSLLDDLVVEEEG